MTPGHYMYEEWRELPADPAYAVFLDPTRTAVVSIDMHLGHLSEDPDCPCPAPRAREIIRPIDQFHDRARALGVRIVHVRSNLRASGIDDVLGIPSAWRLKYGRWAGGIRNMDEHAREGTRWTTFATRVEPSDEIVASKKRLSAFYPTDLDFLLRQQGVTIVVLDGTMTDCCVLNAAFDASNLNYRVVVLRDLVRGTNEELESAALKIMSLNTGLVMDSADLLQVWAAWTPTQALAPQPGVAAS